MEHHTAVPQPRRVRSTFATVLVGAVVLSLFGTGTAVAGGLITSARIKNGTVKSIDVRNDNLQGVDVRDGSLTGADIADGTLSSADLAAASPPKQSSPVYFAQVGGGGVVAASSGGVTATKLAGTGHYRLDFGRDVSTCAYAGTVGNMDAASWVGIVSTAASSPEDPEGVFVATHDLAGSPEDLPFQVIVAC